MRIEKLRKQYDLDVVWTQFPLHPDTPAEGRNLREMFGSDVDAMHTRMGELMAELGLPWGERTMTWNSRLAQELAKWGDTMPGAEALHDALFRAYFAEGRNISDPAVLVDIAESAGLPGEEARKVLDTRAFSEAVDADWRRSREVGITGVPTFVAGRHAVVGAQPYEILEHLVEIALQTSS